MKQVKRISVTGPESTGKSWLCDQLAFYYLTSSVPEYSREYLAKIGRQYTYDDILKIAEGQLLLEDKAANEANRFLFCDTDFIVNKIWCEVKYGKCHPWIEEQVKTHRYDFYLLCNIDLPWQFDPLREHPEMRQELFDLYENELKSGNFLYAVVSGTGSERFRNARKIIESNLV
jgi:NadR type nicotinamide-nucleotide adenylyltransferase